MSIHSNNFYSNVLRQSVQVQVILPEPVNAVGQILPDYSSGEQQLPTVWLLHGLGGDATPWLRRTEIETLATQYRVAVVLAETGRGSYTNTVHGTRYWDRLLYTTYAADHLHPSDPGDWLVIQELQCVHTSAVNVAV